MAMNIVRGYKVNSIEFTESSCVGPEMYTINFKLNDNDKYRGVLSYSKAMTLNPKESAALGPIEDFASLKRVVPLTGKIDMSHVKVKYLWSMEQ
ncbi:hypothetical protein ACFQY8_02385 [Alloscardovia venturai]|uniref:Uncharacterized protein n=1 Tax=Alloscardovia venturai TaxID=1769421 RepID=A0ABW2Y4E4_9BIFI